MIGGVPAAAADPRTRSRPPPAGWRGPPAAPPPRAATVAGRLARMPAAERRVRELANENLHLRELYEAWVPTGHFYSPFPDLDDYGRRAAGLRDPQPRAAGHRPARGRAARPARGARRPPRPGVGGRAATCHEHEDRRGDRRYWLDNPAYAHGDGTVLHAMLRHVRPAPDRRGGLGLLVGADPRHGRAAPARHRRSRSSSPTPPSSRGCCGPTTSGGSRSTACRCRTSTRRCSRRWSPATCCSSTRPTS